MISYYGLDRFYENNKEKILDIIHHAYKHGQFLNSPEVEHFEHKLAQFCNRKYAVCVSSCTDALLISLKSLNISEGDEIIIPAFSFIASLNPILHLNATPVFVDVDDKTLTIDIYEIQKKITHKTKAIIVVQLFGSVNNFEELERLSKETSIPIIEDAAQSLGASYNHRKAGSLGKISCFSFDPSKIIHAFGTGGAILTNDENIYERIKQLQYHGKKTNDYIEPGFNSRISSAQAALLNWQLKNIENIIQLRQQRAQLYFDLLKNIHQISFPDYNNKIVTYHKFVIFTQQRDDLKKYLAEKKIQTLIHYDKLLFEYSVLKNTNYKADSIKKAKLITSQALSLPLYPELKEKEIQYICKCIKAFFL